MHVCVCMNVHTCRGYICLIFNSYLLKTFDSFSFYNYLLYDLLFIVSLIFEGINLKIQDNFLSQHLYI